MASLTIRNLDPEAKAKLRIRAAEHGRSMEAEARALLSEALEPKPPRQHIVDRIRQRVAEFGGIDVPEVEDQPVRDPPDFSSPEHDR